jgi:hypothetical protein
VSESACTSPRPALVRDHVLLNQVCGIGLSQTLSFPKFRSSVMTSSRAKTKQTRSTVPSELSQATPSQSSKRPNPTKRSKAAEPSNAKTHNHTDQSFQALCFQESAASLNKRSKGRLCFPHQDTCVLGKYWHTVFMDKNAGGKSCIRICGAVWHRAQEDENTIFTCSPGVLSVHGRSGWFVVLVSLPCQRSHPYTTHTLQIVAGRRTCKNSITRGTQYQTEDKGLCVNMDKKCGSLYVEPCHTNRETHMS